MTAMRSESCANTVTVTKSMTTTVVITSVATADAIAETGEKVDATTWHLDWRVAYPITCYLPLYDFFAFQ